MPFIEDITREILEKKVHDATRLLRDLADLQNGPPLERDREQWEKIMQEVEAFFDENEVAQRGNEYYSEQATDEYEN